MGGLRVAYFSGFVADLIIGFFCYAYIQSIVNLYLTYTQGIIAVFLSESEKC